MFTISPDHMSQLGEGVLIPDGDSLYIYGVTWLIVVTGCEHHIPLEVLRLVANAPAGFYTDWGVLGAKSIAEKEKKFLPDRGNGSRDIYVRIGGKYQSVSVEGVRGLIEQNAECLWGTCYKLDQLFGAGQARPVYNREDMGDKRKFSIEPTAEEYVFNLDKRLLAVSPNIIRPFYEMEFDINCPTRSSGYPTVLGIYSRTHTPDIFGYFAPRRIQAEDIDGRRMFVDAGTCSWHSPEEGRDKLTDYKNYRPGAPDSALAQNPSANLALGVSILRWYGVSDEEIEILYQDGRRKGLLQQAKALSDEISAEAARGPIPQWKIDKFDREAANLEKELGSFEGERLLEQLRRAG